MLKYHYVKHVLKYNLITTIVALITLTGCMQTRQSHGGKILPVNTENLNAKTIENDGIFAGIKILDEVPPGFKIVQYRLVSDIAHYDYWYVDAPDSEIAPRPRQPRQLVKVYTAENYQGYDGVILHCGSLTNAPGDGKDYVLGITLNNYVETAKAFDIESAFLSASEILDEQKRFVEEISTRTKTAPWSHHQFDPVIGIGSSYWKIKSPEYYKSNPEEFSESVAVSNYIDGIRLSVHKLDQICDNNPTIVIQTANSTNTDASINPTVANNAIISVITVKVKSPRLDILEKEEDEERAAIVF